ncbi:MAG TPA: rubredoxin [Dissulfurispiraceae bacterium]|nr:rubredoxin [Thermodesulfovibrionales bacterium]HMK57073.1 rubredoxin [Dissulfurispiraceae bacterium]
MEISIEKISGGFRVDGLELRGGKCGCTSVLPCCFSWSKVKRSGNTISFTAKSATPETTENFTWGYTIRKGDITVEVKFDDARDKKIYSGFYPPRLNDWTDRGWEAISQMADREDGRLWRCAACKWLYKEDDQPVKFEDLPSEWLCPVCRAGKDSFEDIG